jgi:hypothetical protein
MGRWIARAKTLLIGGDRGVTEVSFAIGIAYQANFFRPRFAASLRWQPAPLSRGGFF